MKFNIFYLKYLFLKLSLEVKIYYNHQDEYLCTWLDLKSPQSCCSLINLNKYHLYLYLCIIIKTLIMQTYVLTINLILNNRLYYKCEEMSIICSIISKLNFIKFVGTDHHSSLNIVISFLSMTYPFLNLWHLLQSYIYVFFPS